MSSSLSISLAVAALAVLLLLALHGLWTTRRARPRQARVDETASTRVEPSMEASSPTAADDVPTQPLDDAPLRSAHRPALRIDALIDVIVPLMLESPISSEALLAHLPGTHRVGSKVIHIEGLVAETGRWEVPVPGQRFGELQVAVQLVSRSGPLNEIEYSELVQKAEALAEAVGARADPPDMLEVVARARELDGLTSPLDAQLTVTLRSNGVAWSVAYVQQVAVKLGFVLGAVPGRLVLPASEEGAPPLLVLSFDSRAALAEQPETSAVRECGLSLDVPQTPESAEPFPLWHRTATALAAELDATPCDDHGEPVSLQAFAAIGEELSQLYRRLRDLDLAAGSPAARRLFS